MLSEEAPSTPLAWSAGAAGRDLLRPLRPGLHALRPRDGAPGHGGRAPAGAWCTGAPVPRGRGAPPLVDEVGRLRDVRARRPPQPGLLADHGPRRVSLHVRSESVEIAEVVVRLELGASVAEAHAALAHAGGVIGAYLDDGVPVRLLTRTYPPAFYRDLAAIALANPDEEPQRAAQAGLRAAGLAGDVADGPVTSHDEMVRRLATAEFGRAAPAAGLSPTSRSTPMVPGCARDPVGRGCGGRCRSWSASWSWSAGDQLPHRGWWLAGIVVVGAVYAAVRTPALAAIGVVLLAGMMGGPLILLAAPTVLLLGHRSTRADRGPRAPAPTASPRARWPPRWSPSRRSPSRRSPTDRPHPQGSGSVTPDECLASRRRQRAGAGRGGHPRLLDGRVTRATGPGTCTGAPGGGVPPEPDSRLWLWIIVAVIVVLVLAVATWLLVRWIRRRRRGAGPEAALVAGPARGRGSPGGPAASAERRRAWRTPTRSRRARATTASATRVRPSPGTSTRARRPPRLAWSRPSWTSSDDRRLARRGVGGGPPGGGSGPTGPLGDRWRCWPSSCVAGVWAVPKLTTLGGPVGGRRRLVRAVVRASRPGRALGVVHDARWHLGGAGRGRRRLRGALPRPPRPPRRRPVVIGGSPGSSSPRGRPATTRAPAGTSSGPSRSARGAPSPTWVPWSRPSVWSARRRRRSPTPRAGPSPATRCSRSTRPTVPPPSAR